MKKFATKIILLIIAIVCSGVTPSFAKDYLDKIAKKSCKCIQSLHDTIPYKQKELQMGLCIINESMPYAAQLERDHGIVMENIEQQGEELGMLIAMRMTAECPEVLMALANMPDTQEDESSVSTTLAPEESKFSFEGKVKSVDVGTFVVFSIRSSKGKSKKFYWMTEIKSNANNLEAKHKEQKGKNAKVIYVKQLLFDARIGEYRQFNVIKEINFSK